MMHQYDPEHVPDAEEWLELDEQERIIYIEQYHRLARTELPNLTLHSAFHAIVENQIAEGLEPVLRAMERLANEGLTRHDAIHAIGFVVANHIHDLFNLKGDPATSQARYSAAVDRLTATSWRNG